MVASIGRLPKSSKMGKWKTPKLFSKSIDKLENSSYDAYKLNISRITELSQEGAEDMMEKILEELEQKIAMDKAKGSKGYGSVNMEMPKDVFGHYDGEYNDGLIIYYPNPYWYSKQYSVLEDTADIHFKFDTLRQVAEFITDTYYDQEET